MSVDIETLPTMGDSDADIRRAINKLRDAAQEALDVLAAASGVQASIAANGGSVAIDGFGNVIVTLASGRELHVGNTTFDSAGNFITSSSGFYVANDGASFYLGAAYDTKLYRGAANALATDGSLLVRSSPQNYGLYVMGQNAGHLTAILQAASGQNVSTLQLRDGGGTERSGFNKTQDLEFKDTRSPIFVDRTTGVRYKQIIDNGNIVLRTLDGDNNETGTFKTFTGS